MTTTIRDTVEQAIVKHAAEAAIRQHERGHVSLLVYPDGEIVWSERVSANEWQVLRGGTTPVASLLTIDNSAACNCDACVKGDNPRDWAGDDAADTADGLAVALVAIAQGYFDDEQIKGGR